MCLISVLNLKKINIQGEHYFLIGAKKKNMKKIGQFSETYISITTGLISFKFGM